MSLYGHLIIFVVLTSCGFGKITFHLPLMEERSAKENHVNISRVVIERKLTELHIHTMMLEKESRLKTTATLNKLQIIRREIERIEAGLRGLVSNNSISRTQMIQIIREFSRASLPRTYSVTRILGQLKEEWSDKRLKENHLAQELKMLQETMEYQVFEKNIEHLSYVSAVDSRAPAADKI